MPLPVIAGLALGRILSWVIAALIFKVIAAFGVGYVVLTGVDMLIEGAFAEIQGIASGLPANLLRALVLLRVDDAIAVFASAVSIRISLKTFGIGAGELKKLAFGLPPAGTP